LSTNDLGLALLDPGGTRRAESNALNLPGLTGRRERVTVAEPAPGSWRARVTHTLGPVATSQAFSGTLEVTRVEYAPMPDVDGLRPSLREEIYQNVRSLVMRPLGLRFRPEFSVSRMGLAATLLLGARVPQYLAGRRQYADVRAAPTRLVIESAQGAPGGPLFPDAAERNRFRPDDRADRFTSAVALVNAAGLRAEAEAKVGAPLALTDARSIPAALRGYVAVALDRRLLAAEGGAFRPDAALTRAELAHAMAGIAAVKS